VIALSPDVRSTAADLGAALELLRVLPHREVARMQLHLVGTTLTRAGRFEAAARIHGAAVPMDDWSLIGITEETRADLTLALGQERLDELLDEGSRMAIDEALDLAIQELDAVAASKPH
jgi:hypothetical protein